MVLWKMLMGAGKGRRLCACGELVGQFDRLAEMRDRLEGGAAER